MGSRIATNLINAGYSVTIWNRSPQPTKALAAQGATVAATPKQAAEQTDIVLSMLTDDNASKAVWLTPETGAVYGLTPNKIGIEMSTLSVKHTQALAKAITEQGASFIESPVVGSRPQAEAQKLICLVGGSADTLEQVQPLLSDISSAIHHVGQVGQGMAMKLAVNALFGIQVAALAELLAVLNQQGIASKQTMNCLSEIPVMSPAAKCAGSAIAAKKYVPLFPIHLVEKDFRYACQLSAQTPKQMYEQMPITAYIQRLYQSAIEQGYALDNITGIAQLFS